MIVLSPRLKTAADMVRKGVVAADIGTDHAYLPSYLVLSGICPRALACDLRKGPLENAAETLERRGRFCLVRVCFSRCVADPRFASCRGERRPSIFYGMCG